MAITQDRLVKLLSACSDYKSRLDDMLEQSRRLSKTDWMSAEEKWTTLCALVQDAGKHSPADLVLMEEQVHYKVYGKANERKKRWQQQNKPKQQREPWELPSLQEPEPPPLRSPITMDSIEEEVLDAVKNMTDDVKQQYFRNADPQTKKIMAKQNPALAAAIESELATQQMEKAIQRNPQDFFRAFAPEPSP